MDARGSRNRITRATAHSFTNESLTDVLELAKQDLEAAKHGTIGPMSAARARRFYATAYNELRRRGFSEGVLNGEEDEDVLENSSLDT